MSTDSSKFLQKYDLQTFEIQHATAGSGYTGKGRSYSRTFTRPSAGILIKTSEPRRRRSKVSTGHTYEA